MKKVNILEVLFSTLNLRDTLDYIEEQIESTSETFHIITANPEIVMQINRDQEFKTIADKANLITPDGIGIVKAADILRRPVNGRVTGVELLEGLLPRFEASKTSVYFLGANEETINIFQKKVSSLYPNLKILGCRNGYFDLDDMSIVDHINACQPDFLFTGMGSPRGQKWFNRYRNELKIKGTMDIGGGFDAMSGTVKRAPKWIIFLNIEWLYRRFQNPSRKGRQKDLYRFAFDVIKLRFKK